MNKPLQGKSHSIVSLSVHLPEQRSIVIKDLNDSESVEAALNRSSTLLVHFELNRSYSTARHYTYTEIPAHYVFKQDNVNGNKIYR